MNNLQLRLATENDADILFEWANEVKVRENSFDSKPIKWDEHVKWLKKSISNPQRYLYIMELEGIPCGMIRLDCFNVENNVEAEISYSIAKEYRGKGYGKIILSLIEMSIIEKELPIDRFIAKVKPNNEASRRAFTSQGFNEDYISLSKEIKR